MKRLALILAYTFPLLLGACQSGKGKLRISGEMKNLDQADFLLVCLDGPFDDVDTLHLKKGKFDKELPLTGGPYTFTVIYPNFHTLSFQASEGQHVQVEGDALALADVRVEGVDSLLPAVSAAPRVVQLAVGDTLPMSELQQHCHSLGEKRYVLLGFWASWKAGSSVINFNFRKQLRTHKDTLRAVSVCLDVDPEMRRMSEMRDSVKWDTYCDYGGMASPLVRQFGLTSLPYVILLSPQGRILALGTDFKKDIEPALDKMTER